jgi:hypothetical protein
MLEKNFWSWTKNPALFFACNRTIVRSCPAGSAVKKIKKGVDLCCSNDYYINISAKGDTI